MTTLWSLFFFSRSLNVGSSLQTIYDQVYNVKPQYPTHDSSFGHQSKNSLVRLERYLITSCCCQFLIEHMSNYSFRSMHVLLRMKVYVLPQFIHQKLRSIKYSIPNKNKNIWRSSDVLYNK